jgi:hypothetical protein
MKSLNLRFGNIELKELINLEALKVTAERMDRHFVGKTPCAAAVATYFAEVYRGRSEMGKRLGIYSYQGNNYGVVGSAWEMRANIEQKEGAVIERLKTGDMNEVTNSGVEFLPGDILGLQYPESTYSQIAKDFNSEYTHIGINVGNNGSPIIFHHFNGEGRVESLEETLDLGLFLREVIRPAINN